MFLLSLIITFIFAGKTEAKITSVEDLEQAELLLACRTKVSKNNLGGGSGTVIQHKAGDALVILTALHVTEGCEEAGGELYAASREKLVDSEGNVYQDETIFIPLKEIAKDPQHDLSIVVTTKKFAKQYPVVPLAKEYVGYLSPVITAGYPAPFRNPGTLIMTVGYVNSPYAPFVVCDMSEMQLNKIEKQKEFFKDILGFPIQIRSVWDCDERSGYPTTPIDILLSDAEIGPGNSGGAMLNDQFELVGVTVAACKMGNWRSIIIPLKYVKELVKKTPYADSILGTNGGK